MEYSNDIWYYITHFDYLGYFANITSQFTLEFIIYALIAYFFVIWIAILLWVARDIMSRTRNWFYQIFCILLILLGTPLGVFVYLIVRPGRTLLEKYYDTSLDDFESENDEDDIVEVECTKQHTCFECHKDIDEKFLFCPYCSIKLKTECTDCKKEIQTNWKTCPFCGVDQEKEKQEQENEVTPSEEDTFGKEDITPVFENSIEKEEEKKDVV